VNSNVLAPESVRRVWLKVSASVARKRNRAGKSERSKRHDEISKGIDAPGVRTLRLTV